MTTNINPTNETSNYGFAYGYMPYGAIDFNGLLTALNKDVNANNYNELMINISRNLPDNYLFYKTNSPKTIDKNTNERYMLLDFIPAIFNKGKMYSFIKPEHKSI